MLALLLSLARAADPCAEVDPVYAGPPLHAPVTLPARPSVGDIDAALSASLTVTFERTVALTKATHMTAAIALPGGGRWSAAHHDGPPLAPWWASVGKLFTAAVVLELYDEGKLNLDDPLSRYVPDFPRADRVTIRQLLSHTSGIYSFQEDRRLRKDPRWHAPDELLQIAARHAPTACPGVYWTYSNTGYVLLGKVIEAVDGRPYDEAVRARLLEGSPLRVLPAAPAPPDVVGPTARTRPDPATPWAAGDVWGPASGMVTFLDLLLNGDLLRPETRAAQLATLYPMFGGPTSYGLGLMVFDVPASDKPADTWVGHAGGAPGVSAVAVRSFRTGATVGVALASDGAGDNAATAVANALLALLPSSPPKDP